MGDNFEKLRFVFENDALRLKMREHFVLRIIVVKFFQENHAHEREESVRFFEAGVKEGLFRKDVDFNVVMDVGHVMMEEIMHHQLYRVHSMQEIYDNYILCLIRGFCTERGLEQLDRALKE